MGLLQPELGLLFWTSLAFGVVLFLLCKFGFPVILRSVEERRQFIDSSIDAAHEAEVRLKRVTLDSEAIVEKAGLITALQSEMSIEAEGRVENIHEFFSVAAEFDATHDLEADPDGEVGKNRYCEAYRAFLTEALPALCDIRDHMTK